MNETTKSKVFKGLKISSKIILTLFYIVLCIIILIPVLMFLAMIYEVPEDERIIYLADGSVCMNTGGPTYEHKLFDGYYIHENDNLFQNRLSSYDKELNIPYEYNRGLFFRYAFDPEGYIAYRYLEKWAKPGEPENYLCMWRDEYIITDCSVLYDCNADEVKVFETLPELREYCSNNNINLSDWYNSSNHFCSQEEVHIQMGDWTLTEVVYDYSIVSFGYEDLFAGMIDSYFEAENGFGFHFQHVEDNKYGCQPNPVIGCSETEVVGKKYSGLLFIYDDVYTDKYVYVDINTNEYTVFDSKKEIKEYAKTLGITPDWVKIKYDEYDAK